MLTLTPDHILAHSIHGPVRVSEVRTRLVRGSAVTYVELTAIDSALTISVPVERAREIGLREVFTPEDLIDLFDLLRADGGETETQWSRRFKANQEKLSSGSTESLASVVRDLTRRRFVSGLSSGERDQLEAAKRPLLAELAIVLECTVDRAESQMYEIIMEPVRRSRSQEAARP